MAINIMAVFVTLPVVLLTVTFVYAFRMTTEPEPSPDPGPTRSNWEQSRRFGFKASSISLALVFIATGVPKVSGLNELIHQFQSWGYSDDFMLMIGVTEFAAGILLLVPHAAKYAAGYLSAVMAGAVYTHVAFDSFVWVSVPLFCLSFLFFIAYEDWLGDVHNDEAFGDSESPPAPTAAE